MSLEELGKSLGILHDLKETKPFSLKTVWVYAWLTDRYIKVNSISQLRYYHKDTTVYYFPMGINPNA